MLIMAGALLCVALATAAAEKGGEVYPLKPGAPYFAVYRWGAGNKNGGAAANEAYARWIGQPAVWAEDFEPSERWDSIEGGSWQLGEWSQWKKGGAGRRLILSVPLLPGPWDLSGPTQGDQAHTAVSLEAGARGEYNARFKKLAENLVRYGLGDSVLRLGWEFNGGWYAWRAGKNPEAFAGYWRQIVKTMRAVPGTEKLQFCWNPAMRYLQFPAEKAWPGDQWVDIVGLDVYDDSYDQGTYPYPKDASAAEIARRQRLVWEKGLVWGDHSLKFWCDFARKHNKLFAIPEWGVFERPDTHGGLDDPYFIEQMHKYLYNPANRVYFHCYFDVQAGDGGHQLSPGKSGTEKTKYPQAAKKFKELFGGAGK
jgi:hypothetical protein